MMVQQPRGGSLSTLLALGTFLGTVIGVGLFGLPYVASRAGFFPLVLVFLVLTPVVVAIHLRFVDVTVGTKTPLRIPGYVAHYLGPRWKQVSLIISSLGITGALLAYLIVGGTFLQLLFSQFVPMSTTTGVLIFLVLGALLVARGSASVAWVDLVLICLFFVIVLVLLSFSFPRIASEHFTTISLPELPMSYGVVLFSLWGLTLIPEVSELLQKNKPRMKAVVVTGIAASALVYLLFVIMVLGVTGTGTTQDALTGFVSATGGGLVLVAALFGLITTFTSYITLGLTLKQTMALDLRAPSWLALLLTTLVPFLLYILGFENFIQVIGITGAVLVGAEGALVLATAEAFRRQRQGEQRMHWTTAVLLLILASGVVMELLHFFRSLQ